MKITGDVLRKRFSENPSGFDIALGDRNYRIEGNSGGPIRINTNGEEDETVRKPIDMSQGWLRLEPGESIHALTPDYYDVPTNISLEIGVAEKALGNGLSVQCYPNFVRCGYSGYFLFSIQNIASNPIILKVGDPIARVYFDL